jgi:hypothetical protein
MDGETADQRRGGLFAGMRQVDAVAHGSKPPVGSAGA